MIKKIFDYFGYKILSKKLLAETIKRKHISGLDFHFLLGDLLNKTSDLCLFDVGANVGQTVIKFKEYFPESKIYSFEPVKDTYEILCSNVASFSNVKTFNLAFGDIESKMTINLSSYSHLNSLLNIANASFEKGEVKQEVVNVSTVDVFIRDHNINKIHFFKTDTEGFELNVLRGAKKAMENAIIDFFYVEVGFQRNDKQHTALSEVLDYMESYGYNFCGLFELTYSESVKLYFANALFVRPGYS